MGREEEKMEEKWEKGKENTRKGKRRMDGMEQRDGKGKVKKNKFRIRNFWDGFQKKEWKGGKKTKKRKQIKESNGSCHWEGFKLMRKKRWDKYILQLLNAEGKPQTKTKKKVNEYAPI